MLRHILSWFRSAKPRDYARLAKRALPHAAIVMAGMLIVFFVIDRINKPMGFMTNEFHKRLTFALCLLTIYFAVQITMIQRRAERGEYQRRQRARARADRDTGSARSPRPNPARETYERREAAPQRSRPRAYESAPRSQNPSRAYRTRR